MTDKLITMQDATKVVKSGMTLGIGGVTIYRRPVSFVRFLIEQYQSTGDPVDLTLLAFTAGYECDLLVGAGLVSTVRSCYFGLEIFGLAPMFTYLANHGEIKILEETEASLASGLRAYLAGTGFMPARAWLGTDLPRLRPDVKRIIDPYSGEELMAFPAIHPDVAVIHALQADLDGNALIGKNKGIDEDLALAADYVIVTAEEIIQELDHADLVAPFVHAVVLAPHGASPTSCHPYYPVDGEALLEYVGKVGDPQSFQSYLSDLINP